MAKITGNDDLSFIRDATVYRVSKEEASDISSIMDNYHHQLEVLGEPVHLRLDPDCDLSKFKLEDVLKQVIDDPYNQFVSKVKENVYHFQRGKIPKKRKADNHHGVPLTVDQLLKNGKRPLDLQDSPTNQIEQFYWKEVRRIASTPAAKFLATYGSDILGTCMDYSSKMITLSNLNTELQKVVAKYGKPIPGISTSMLYIGVWMSTFTQHLEDKDLWSTSYLHYGEPKVWYVTPASATQQFESRSNDYLADHRRLKYNGCKTIFRHKNTLVDPRWYRDNGIPLIRIVQRAGDLVILPPYTYHFGFNSGFNYSEAVNLAPRSWVPFGLLAKECDSCGMGETLDMEPFVIELMPKRYREYLSGNMKLVHPFDTNKALQVVPPPPPVEVSEDMILDYMVKSRGLDFIYAARVDNGEKYVYAVIGDIKGWMQEKQVECMNWASTGNRVTIPDHFFTTNEPIDPYYHLQCQEVVIYLRSLFTDYDYGSKDIKFINVYESTEDKKEISIRNGLCRDQLAGGGPGADWLKQAQMVLVFGAVNGKEEKLRTECKRILSGDKNDDSDIFFCQSYDIFGAKLWPLTNLTADKIPRMTGIVIPQMDTLKVKKFSLNREHMTSLENFKRAIGYYDLSLQLMKGLVLMYNHDSAINYVHHILQENPHVAAVGGSVADQSSNQFGVETVVSGFFIYGENVSVGCSVLPEEVNKTILKNELKKVTCPNARSNILAIFFGPKQTADDHKMLDTMIQRQIKKLKPGAELIGLSTGTQIGREIHYPILNGHLPPQNILFMYSKVLMTISY